MHSTLFGCSADFTPPLPIPEIRAAFAQPSLRSLLGRTYAPPGVVINKNMEILQFRGAVGPYDEPSPGNKQALGNLEEVGDHEETLMSEVICLLANKISTGKAAKRLARTRKK